MMFLAAVIACPTATRAAVATAPDSAAALDSNPAPYSVSAPRSVSADSVSARVAVLQLALRVFDDIRVVTDSAKFLRHDVVVSSNGLLLRTPPGASWRITSVPKQERLVPWAEIESVQVRRGASGIGPLAGGVAGLAIGLSIMLLQAPVVIPFQTVEYNGEPILWGVVGGATLGWLLDRPGPWKTVYP